jgi:hypothetical protein
MIAPEPRGLASRVALILLLATLWTAPANADVPTTAHDEAIASFEAARALIKAGDCANAIPKLKESLAREMLVGAHLSLAECYQPTDALAAWRELKEAEFLTYTKNDDRAGIARDRAAALEPRLALLHVTLPPAVLQTPGLEVKLDGVAIDRFYYQSGVIAVAPGKHTVDVRAPGKLFAGAADASVGAKAEILVELADAPPEPPAAPAPAPVVLAPSPGRRTAGLVTGSLGLAGVVLGGVTGVVSLYYAGQAKIECGKGGLPACDASARPDVKNANVFAAVSDAGLFGGGALLVAGVVLYLTAPDVAVEGAPPAPSATWRLVPALGPGVASLVAVGSF